MTRPMPLLDLAFLWLDRPATPSNVGVVLLCDPPTGRTASSAADRIDMRRHVARLHETPLERDRPLFSVHVIEGLASGQLAVYLKTHHSSWDGRYALERIFGQLAREPGAIAAPFFAAPPDHAPAVDTATVRSPVHTRASTSRSRRAVRTPASACRSPTCDGWPMPAAER